MNHRGIGFGEFVGGPDCGTRIPLDRAVPTITHGKGQLRHRYRRETMPKHVFGHIVYAYVIERREPTA